MAIAQGWVFDDCGGWYHNEENTDYFLWSFEPHKNWAQMGLIIQGKKINLNYWHGLNKWVATLWEEDVMTLQISLKGETWGKDALEAASRCIVQSELGDEVEIPHDL